ncbi:MAG: hypothetical protein ACXVCE_02350, partial [Bacteriovorax sp.]
MEPNKNSIQDAQVIKFLSDYFFTLSQTRMSKHCASGFTFNSADFVSHDNCEILGEDTSIALLWGEAGAIVLKVHYDIDVVKHYAASALMKPVEELNSDTVRSFMNEYLNLLAGYFRG